MKARTTRQTKDEALLINMADSIGSTLGAVVGRAYSFKKALSGSPIARKVKRDSRKLTKKRRSVGRKVNHQASTASKTGKQ